MGTHAVLPLEAEAEIESDRAQIFNRASFNFPLLFPSPADNFAPVPLSSLSRPTRPQPATLKLQLRNFALALFDAAARQYVKYAPNDWALRLWLQELADDTKAEVLKETKGQVRDSHCSAAACSELLTELFPKRIEYWSETAAAREKARHAPIVEPITPLSGNRHIWVPPPELEAPVNAPEAQNQPSNPATLPQAAKSMGRQIREPNHELLKNRDGTLNRIQAAEALGVSTRTLDRWVESQLLTPIGGAGRKRFRVKDLRSFVNQTSKDK